MDLRVIVVTDFGTEWKGGHFIVKALKDIGVESIGVDPLNPGMSLLDIVKEFRPDIILLTKGRGIELETIEELKRKGILMVMWYPDYPISDPTIALARKMDYFLTPVEGMLSFYQEKGIKNVSVLPQGFEPSFFHIDDITDDDIRTYGSDITFIGTLEPTHLYRFRSKRLKRVIKEGFNLKWWGRPLSRKIKNIGLMLSPLGMSYGGKPVYLKEFAKVVKTSKIFIAFDAAPDVRKCISVRTYMALGCGAFYMCQHVDGIDEIFMPDEEIITFKTDDEMIDKIRYYLPKEDLRKKIASRAQAKVLKEHTYQARAQQLLNLMGAV